MGHDTKNLHKAKRVKNDEFYTRYEDNGCAYHFP